MWVDTIFDLIENVLLWIILHISNVYIFGNQHNIMIKHLSAINTVSAHELGSADNSWMDVYKESIHEMHVWLELNASTNEIMGKQGTYGNQTV